MADMLLAIRHGDTVFSPPIEDGVKIEWERTGTPGKLTFTTIHSPDGGLECTEGDPVAFYYNEKQIFAGYVFTKKRDKEQNIEVTCYDQIRYLKNKFSYAWENKTASQIISALCDDLQISKGNMDNTNYVIPAIAEENKSALDIILDVLEETLTNTGNLYVIYDDCGKLNLKNAANMVCSTLICSDTAENFDYSSSIDNETYNQVVLYYKQDDKIVQLYTAHSPTTMAQWGTLRYFEEVDSPTIGLNKATALLKLYNKKTRELKISGAFGDPTVRGGTLIPVQLDLGERVVNNFLMVDKVTHNFNNDLYTMDLTLQGYWEDGEYEIVTGTMGELSNTTVTSSSGGGSGGSKYCKLTIFGAGQSGRCGSMTVRYYKDGKYIITNKDDFNTKITVYPDRGSNVWVSFNNGSSRITHKASNTSGWSRNGITWVRNLTEDDIIGVKWTSAVQSIETNITNSNVVIKKPSEFERR